MGLLCIFLLVQDLDLDALFAKKGKKEAKPTTFKI